MKHIEIMLVVATFAGCCTSATIRYRVGSEDGKIVRASRDDIYLWSDELSEPRAIPRAGIVDIDHPGNVHQLVGGLLVLYGVLNILRGVRRCDEEGPTFCAGYSLRRPSDWECSSGA